MNKSVRVVIVDELYSRLHDACTLCASAIWVAPYAKKSVVESLTSALPSEARLTLVTRWHPADIARGVSDTDVLDVVRARPNSELLLHPSLHAKVFLCDDYAFIGSANLTNSGVGLGSRPNVELSTLLQPAPTAVGVFLNRVIYESTIATAKIKAAIDEQAREYERIYGDERQSISLVYQSPDEWHPPWLFPQLRAPDRLFAIYSDADDLPVDVRQDAWRIWRFLIRRPTLDGNNSSPGLRRDCWRLTWLRGSMNSLRPRVGLVKCRRGCALTMIRLYRLTMLDNASLNR
jgi:hypothetical protein